jgi:RNA polymerase sigma-70 factor (ECF subfamily)
MDSSLTGQIVGAAGVNQIDAIERETTAGRLPDLVRAAQDGDAMAMAELLDILTPYVARLCGPIALDDGADAAQEALITIFTGIGQLREPAALFGWVRVITIREAVRVATMSRRGASADLEDVPARGDPQLASDVRDVLCRLAPHHRAILVLRDLEGLDEQTVSDMLAVSAGTAKSRLHRARRRFRQEWDR